ncbi:MAG: NAD-dependent epimerase/dehydratase family protein [Crocinitomicaceae bacterium]
MVFVTGSSGLVGSHLLYALSEKGIKIRAMYRERESIKNVEKLFEFYNLQKKKNLSLDLIEWVQGDILDVNTLDMAMKEVHTVFHCAALVSFLKSDFHKCMKINRMGTANVVNSCLQNNIKKLCYVSSTAALGNSNNPITEETNWQAGAEVSGYSVSKHSAEKEVFRGIAEGLNASIVNPCLILGPGDWAKSSLTLFRAAKKGLPFYTTGTNAVVDARDVADFLLLLADSEENGEKYLLIGENISFRNLFSFIAPRLKARPPKYKLSAFLAKPIAYFLESILHLFRIKSPFSIESVQSAYKQLSYDNNKAIRRFDYTFYTMEESVLNAIEGRFYD